MNPAGFFTAGGLFLLFALVGYLPTSRRADNEMTRSLDPRAEFSVLDRFMLMRAWVVTKSAPVLLTCGLLCLIDGAVLAVLR